MKKSKKYKPSYRISYNKSELGYWTWAIIIWSYPCIVADVDMSSVELYDTADECEAALYKVLKALGLNKVMKKIK